jgi:GNAT superfamily N-acetyltransferase
VDGVNLGVRSAGVGGANLDVRVATAADLDPIVAALTTAFFDDPLWGPAFPDRGRRAEQAGALWRLFAGSASRFPWTLVTQGAEAVAVWIPPGEDELTAEQEAGFEDFIVDLTGREVADGILALVEEFEQLRPSDPHFYLSLLATHSGHRGSGLGMGLLRESLARIDALGVPSYLESSNPANDKRYRSVGFTAHGGFTAASGHRVTTMWRPAGGNVSS